MTSNAIAGRSVVDAARNFIPILKARGDEIESARRLPQDLADDFAEAGFYRLCIPEVYGGLEASPVTMFDVIETLATADASAAWCVFIGACRVHCAR
jgi:alkylation response protein AidB-like acyl-CoA dehydrogenase